MKIACAAYTYFKRKQTTRRLKTNRFEELFKVGKVLRETEKAVLAAFPMWGTFWVPKAWIQRMESSPSQGYLEIIFRPFEEIFRKKVTV